MAQVLQCGLLWMDHQEWYPLPSCKIQQWMGELVSWMWFIVRLLCFSPERFKQFFWMLGMQHIGRLGTPMMKSVNWHGPGLDLSPKCILHATSGSSFQWWNSCEDDSLGNGVKMLLGLWQRALGAWMAMHAFMAIEALSGFYVQPWWLVCVSFLVWLQLIT